MAKMLMLLCVALLFQTDSGSKPASGPAVNTPRYTVDGRMEFPANYREWVYLSTGVNMDYNPSAMAMNHTMFDNVFVNPEAYKVFKETGKWPDKTMMALEGRVGESKGSINKAGEYQSTQLMGRSVHVKDVKRFAGGWAFFGFDDDGKPAEMIPTKASCYSCHEQHAAVDTTFVQFYPVALEIAKSKKTLSAAYLKEVEDSKPKVDKGEKKKDY